MNDLLIASNAREKTYNETLYKNKIYKELE